MTSSNMPNDQQPQGNTEGDGAHLAPDVFAISQAGRLILGYHVPPEIGAGPAEDRLAWTQQRLNVSVSAILNGMADEYVKENAPDKEYEGYDIAFLSPVEDPQMPHILSESQKTLPRDDIHLVWECTAAAAPDVAQQMERDIAWKLKEISEQEGSRVVMWAVVVGDRKEAGLLKVPADGGEPTPLEGAMLNELGEMILHHKQASYVADGQTWISLMVHADASEGFYFDPKRDEVPPWVNEPSDEDWARERAIFPVGDSQDTPDVPEQ